MEPSAPRRRAPLVAALIETFGFSPAAATAVAFFLLGIAGLVVLWFVRSAPPRTLVLTSGPAGSSFERYALAYQKELATHGVTLQIRPSLGSSDNLQRLRTPTEHADIGFVLSGLAKDENLTGLVSLGSVAYQPIFCFYRNPTPIARLSELAGKRLALGAPGSGSRALAQAILALNGITGAPTTFVDLDAEAASTALLEGRIDAAFLMGDSAPTQILRTLVRTPDVQIFSVGQADAYLRRLPNLNRMRLPEGSFDIGKNLPARDITLIGPTVELVARDGLNSALSDLLLEVARTVHGNASLLQKRGEFPAPLEHEFTLSDDALRYYKGGKSFFYRNIRSFWVASVLNRLAVAIVPVILLLIPAIRFFPVLYRWTISLRIYRCYRPLLRLERDAFGPLTPDRVRELLHQLDELESMVDRVKVPASFASQFYELRGHIAFVRRRLESARPAA